MDDVFFAFESNETGDAAVETTSVFVLPPYSSSTMEGRQPDLAESERGRKHGKKFMRNWAVKVKRVIAPNCDEELARKWAAEDDQAR